MLIDPNEFERFSETLTLKSLAWSYEKEYRWIVPLKRCIEEQLKSKKIEFIKIKPEAILRIDIGVNSSEKFRKAVLKILSKNKFKHVEVKEATLDSKKFKLNYLSEIGGHVLNLS